MAHYHMPRGGADVHTVIRIARGGIDRVVLLKPLVHRFRVALRAVRLMESDVSVQQLGAVGASRRSRDAIRDHPLADPDAPLPLGAGHKEILAESARRVAEGGE